MTDTPGDVAAKLEELLRTDLEFTADESRIITEAASMLRDMGEREKALLEALEPFARVYGLSCEPFQPDHKAGARDYLPGAWPTVGDLRRAAKALSAPPVEGK